MRNYQEKTTSNLSIKELPMEERPREKLCTTGPLSLSDVELLTVMIGSGTSRIPAQKLALQVQEFLDQHQTTPEITVTDLSSVDGMGIAKASVICAALELGRRRLPSKRKQIVFPSDVYPLIRHYGSRQQEHFLCVSLNGAHEVVSVNVVSIGLVNHTLVHPREVFADPLRERATAVIVAHNHPSGNLAPSMDDKNVTSRLRKAGELLGIQVLDHLIFSDETFHSMLEENEF
ncbi:MAG: DNA repair protein RadC [Sphaerochaetaceae bacterium]